MHRFKLIPLFVFIFILANGAMGAEGTAAPGAFDIRAFGAKGDGKTLDTQAIQAAIDTCAKSGGGRVVLAGGTFLSGTIVLKSNVTLELETGATLLGSTDLADYPSHVAAMRSYTDEYTEKSLIYAEKQERIGIMGRGTINGQGGAEPFKGKPYKERPYLIRVIECQDVAVRDVKILDSPMWVQHYLGCEGVLIDGITVHSRVNANNDGIDIDCCERVRIANCDIFSGDDAIVIKSTADRLCRFITVTNCVLSTLCSAIKTGTESNGGFQDITISNCVIYDTRLAGIALELVDGGKFERVTVSGITMKNVLGGIFVRLGNRARPFKADQQPQPGMGTMKDIIIRDVQATGIGPVGCSITGLPEHPVENVTLENIRITYAGGGKAESVQKEVPEKPTAYPEFGMFGQLPAYGFYVRHARNVRFENVELGFAKDDPRPAMVCDDVRELELLNFKAGLTPAAPALVRFNDVADALIQRCRLATEGTGTARAVEAPLLALSGAQTEQIRLRENDLGGLKEAFRKGPEVKAEAVEMGRE